MKAVDYLKAKGKNEQLSIDIVKIIASVINLKVIP